MDNNYMKTILSGVKEWTENLTDDAKDKANNAIDKANNALDKALFVVNITTTDGETFSADKTFDEIVQVYNEGKYSIVADWDGLIMPLSEITENVQAIFDCTSGNDSYLITITKNNEVLQEVTLLATTDAKLPNPYPLTFTGAVNETYDGSSAKTIEIPSGGGLGNFERIGTVNFSKEGMAAAGAGVDFEVSDVSEIVLIYKNLVNSTKSNNLVNVYLNKSSQNIESSLRPDSGKSGSPVNGWAFIKLLPGVGLTGIQSNSTFSATNYALSNAKTPYNMIPLASDFRITEISIQNPPTQYYAVGGIVQVYVR